jgi:nucleotide-binding universal stress UspA family protein
MTPRIIISYDDTDNDRDALALGRLLAVSGANLSLAYVRHMQLPERELEEHEEQQAAELLERGAQAIGAPDMQRHVVFHASTGEGLLGLAEREAADVVVFGSDYRTASGAVLPGRSAERLLNGGSVAVAIAPADLRSHSAVKVARVGVLGEGDDAAQTTADSLASALDASVTDASDGHVDLLVVGSREGARNGRVELSAAAEYAIETATSPVLVVPRGNPVRFAQPALAAS